MRNNDVKTIIKTLEGEKNLSFTQIKEKTGWGYHRTKQAIEDCLTAGTIEAREERPGRAYYTLPPSPPKKTEERREEKKETQRLKKIIETEETTIHILREEIEEWRRKYFQIKQEKTDLEEKTRQLQEENKRTYHLIQRLLKDPL